MIKSYLDIVAGSMERDLVANVAKVKLLESVEI